MGALCELVNSFTNQTGANYPRREGGSSRKTIAVARLRGLRLPALRGAPLARDAALRAGLRSLRSRVDNYCGVASPPQSEPPASEPSRSERPAQRSPAQRKRKRSPYAGEPPLLVFAPQIFGGETHGYSERQDDS